MNQDIYFCKDCRNNCVFTSSNLTCTYCGLEQDVPVFQDEIGVWDRACVYENMVKEEENVQKNVSKHFEYIQTMIDIPEQVIDDAKNIYKEYLKVSSKTIKGEERKLEFCCACVLYASKNMNTGILSQSYIIYKVFQSSEKNISIQWACKDLQDNLSNIPQFKTLFKSSTSYYDIIDRNVRFFYNFIKNDGKKDGKKESKDFKEWFKIVHKLFDNIENKDRDFVRSTHPDKLIASLIFVACKILKHHIKLKDFSILFNTSEPLILRIENKVLHSMNKKYKSKPPT